MPGDEEQLKKNRGSEREDEGEGAKRRKMGLEEVVGRDREETYDDDGDLDLNEVAVNVELLDENLMQ